MFLFVSFPAPHHRIVIILARDLNKYWSLVIKFLHWTSPTHQLIKPPGHVSIHVPLACVPPSLRPSSPPGSDIWPYWSSHRGPGGRNGFKLIRIITSQITLFTRSILFVPKEGNLVRPFQFGRKGLGSERLGVMIRKNIRLALPYNGIWSISVPPVLSNLIYPQTQLNSASAWLMFCPPCVPSSQSPPPHSHNQPRRQKLRNNEIWEEKQWGSPRAPVLH